MVGLVEGESRRPSHEDSQHVVFALGDDEDEEDEHPQRSLAGSAGSRRPSLLRHWSPPSRNSTASEGTLHDSPTSESPVDGLHRKPNNRAGAYDAEVDELQAGPAWREEEQSTKTIKAGRWAQILLTWIRRTQVVFAYVTLIIGITTYTVSFFFFFMSVPVIEFQLISQGMCRASYVNSCAAHYIKGSIFFGYGLLTFARYLGAYADLGWAWNRHTGSRRGPSAEMVECAVIFTYGITNTWMERMGAKSGDPYTVKQVQHISIAVM